MKHIAIVEDELAIRENYMDVLTQQGYQVSGYANRQLAEAAFAIQLPDLVIIDIGLEDELDGGFLLCQNVRKQSDSLPVIFLTARDNEIDTICGLRMGADDYLTKDISVMHLVARVSAIFRRIEALAAPIDNSGLIKTGKLTLDTHRMQCIWDDKTIELTVTEFWMVHALANKPGHVKSRQQLMTDAKIFVDDSTITSHVKRIRN